MPALTIPGITNRIFQGDVRKVLRTFPANSVQCVVTSPPYWGLRDYGTAEWEGGDVKCDHKGGRFSRGGLTSKQASNSGSNGDESFKSVCPKCGARRIDSQLGLEPTPEEFVANMVAIFREVRRVLRPDGTLWLNLGDTYYSGTYSNRNNATGSLDATASNGFRLSVTRERRVGKPDKSSKYPAPTVPDSVHRLHRHRGPSAKNPPVVRGGGERSHKRAKHPTLKPGDLCGIPWRVAFALQADGWILRSDTIWSKPNPMPESVQNRPTKAHEYLFLFAKSEDYFYDAEAVREPHNEPWRSKPKDKYIESDGPKDEVHAAAVMMGYERHREYNPSGRNKRSVWTIPTQPYPEAHFATFPTALVEPCIKAGTSEAGCCAKCGRPWERVIQGSPSPPKELYTRTKKPKDGYVNTNENGGWGQKWQQWKNENPVKSIGFQPSCRCESETRPCIVLDPFMGSGTTGAVAQELGRWWVGVELSPEYIKLAEKRIGSVQATQAFRSRRHTRKAKPVTVTGGKTLL